MTRGTTGGLPIRVDRVERALALTRRGAGFRVRLSNNTTLDVADPGVVIVGPTSAIMPIHTTKDDFGYVLVDQGRTVALSHMAEFVDLEPPKPPAKRRNGK